MRGLRGLRRLRALRRLRTLKGVRPERIERIGRIESGRASANGCPLRNQKVQNVLIFSNKEFEFWKGRKFGFSSLGMPLEALASSGAQRVFGRFSKPLGYIGLPIFWGGFRKWFCFIMPICIITPVVISQWEGFSAPMAFCFISGRFINPLPTLSPYFRRLA